jgi:hypothetical protein
MATSPEPEVDKILRGAITIAARALGKMQINLELSDAERSDTNTADIATLNGMYSDLVELHDRYHKGAPYA